MKNAREMKLVKVNVEDDVERFQVIDKKDNWVWSESGSARGAIQGVLAILGWNKSILNKIDFFDFKQEVGFIRLR